MEAFRATRVIGEQVTPAYHALLNGEAAVGLSKRRDDQVFQVDVVDTGNFELGHPLSVAGLDGAEHVLDAVVLRVVRNVLDRSDVEACEAVADSDSAVRRGIVPEDCDLFLRRSRNADAREEFIDLVLTLELLLQVDQDLARLYTDSGEYAARLHAPPWLLRDYGQLVGHCPCEPLMV